jgi:hypothetical protein
MASLRIRRFDARYHLTASRRHERKRLDRVLHAMLDDPLDRALEHAGVSPSEEVCIRRLHVPVRLRLSSADSTLALSWSLAIGELIAKAQDRQGSPDVVRYSSIVQLLLDVAIGVASGRFERAWAWRMSGVWHASNAPSPCEAVDELVAAMLDRPHAIVPVLTALAAPGSTRHLFSGLWRQVAEAQWVALSRAALVAAGGAPGLIEDAVTPGVAEISAIVHEAMRGSTLCGAVAALGRSRLEAASAELRRAVAVLIVLERDPGAVRGTARTRSLVSALSDALHPAAGRAARADVPRHPTGAPAPPVVIGGEEDAPPVVMRRGVTAHGGLLFLLNLFEELALPAAIDEGRGDRSFRWVLHQLGMLLCSVGPDDPAALAFAGLPPKSVPPSRDEAPATADESLMLAGLAERLTRAVGERIEEDNPLPFVCGRRAEVIADPGWLQVRFACSDAATSIRRAGLDLNPGFVPWLGTVVMFSYD